MGKNIVIRFLHVATTFYETEAISLLLCDFAFQLGGSAWAAWQGTEIKVHIRRISHKDLRVGLDVLCKGTLKDRGSLFLIEMEDRSPYCSPVHGIPWGTVLREPRLTRQLFFSLPSRCYVVARSGFTRKLGKNREAAWQCAVSERAEGRTCYIGWSAEQFEEQKRWLNVLSAPDPSWYLPPMQTTQRVVKGRKKSKQ